ncbi:MAG TPA: M20 family metallopeptidase [Verrucomicrobiae bacterium]|nr:M20 family metallopeptidase [Verrucomicrobiae bacterium]
MIKPRKLLQELVALPSVNPAFLPAGHPRAGEKPVGEFLATTAATAGLEVEFQPVLPGRDNFFARLLPSGDVQQRILLAPHLDTVNGTDDQFVPRVENGRLYGRGACDTKGSVAAMMAALCNVARSGRRPQQTELIFAGLVDEEDAQSGSRALKEFEADLAVVGEATNLKVVTCHKGSLWLRLETHGRAAHGARPELGRNAVFEMARVVQVLEREYAEQLRRRMHPLLGRPTVNVGAIAGGTQPNIVPDHCYILVDRRTLPRETEASVRQELLELLKQHQIKATLGKHKPVPCLPLETHPALPLVKELMRTARQRLAVGVDYFCDASVLAHDGIPSVVFGPGDIAQAHTANEWISLSQLDQATALLETYFRALP